MSAVSGAKDSQDPKLSHLYYSVLETLNIEGNDKIEEQSLIKKK